MKRGVALLCLVLMLCGCQSQDAQLQTVNSLRERLLTMNSCSFQACIRADYGELSYAFSVSCQGDREGNLQFDVISPETIEGIRGNISAQGGQLTFDDAVLGFPLLADGEVSPVSAPWILLRTLLGGYISACTEEGDYLHVMMDDSYESEALQLDVWLNANSMPHYAEIIWQGRRVLSIEIISFSIV